MNDFANKAFNLAIFSMIAADMNKVYGSGTTIPEMEADYKIEISYDTNTVSQILNAAVFADDIDYSKDIEDDDLSTPLKFGKHRGILFIENAKGYFPVVVRTKTGSYSSNSDINIVKGLLSEETFDKYVYYDPAYPSAPGLGSEVYTFHHANDEIVAPEELVESTRLIEPN